MSDPAQGQGISWLDMLPVIGTLLGVLLGFLLSEVKHFWVRRRRIKAHWAALRAELELSRLRAQSYLEDNIRAPLYRLPTEAFDTSVPFLLSEGAIREEELSTISKSFSNIKDFNRGLGFATELLGSVADEGNELLDKVANRNILYAKQLIPGQDPEESYSEALCVINNHLDR